jgi:hypothetical protein
MRTPNGGDHVQIQRPLIPAVEEINGKDQMGEIGPVILFL